jgi:uncharacterized membrane protein
MEELPRHVLFTVMQWIHIVSTTLIVGGTLFFEFVVPIAIEDLKEEQQFAVFGKARWVFKRVVWVSAVLLLLSGAVSISRLWGSYHEEAYKTSRAWVIGHVALGLVAMGIALLLTVRRRPPDHPVGWMQFNLILLLVGIFAANVARHVRLLADEREAAIRSHTGMMVGAPRQPTTTQGTDK